MIRRLIQRVFTDSKMLVMLLISAFIWAFISIADEVMEGETATFDEWLLLSLRNPVDKTDPLGPRWVEELARDVTALGSVGILTFLVLAAAGSMWLRGAHRETLFLLASTITGGILSRLLKAGFDRPRPDLVPHGSYVYTASFPSGHSMMSAVVYLTLGVLLAGVVQGGKLKVYILTLSVFLAVAVGISRIYLGVHWPTDVAAGWTAGAGWALICGAVARWLDLRRP